MKRRKLFRLVAALAAVVLVAGMFAACSKADDNDGKKENPGGNIIDPNVPVLSNITYEMAPDAVLVPEATAKEISNVDTLGHKFTLPLSADEPQVGQTLIINTPSKQLHDGLLAKVTGVEETSRFLTGCCMTIASAGASAGTVIPSGTMSIVVPSEVLAIL